MASEREYYEHYKRNTVGVYGIPSGASLGDAPVGERMAADRAAFRLREERLQEKKEQDIVEARKQEELTRESIQHTYIILIVVAAIAVLTFMALAATAAAVLVWITCLLVAPVFTVIALLGIAFASTRIWTDVVWSEVPVARGLAYAIDLGLGSDVNHVAVSFVILVLLLALPLYFFIRKIGALEALSPRVVLLVSAGSIAIARILNPIVRLYGVLVPLAAIYLLGTYGVPSVGQGAAESGWLNGGIGRAMALYEIGGVQSYVLVVAPAIIGGILVTRSQILGQTTRSMSRLRRNLAE